MPSASTSTDGLVSYVTTGMQQSESIRNNLPLLPEWIDGIIRNRNAPVSHSSDSDLLDDCAICFQSFTQDIERCRVRLFCGHRHFCLACMKDWAREGKTTCPYCRKQEWYPHMPLRILLRSTIGLSTSEASTTSQVTPIPSRATSPPDYLRWMAHALRYSVSVPEVVTEDYTPSQGHLSTLRECLPRGFRRNDISSAAARHQRDLRRRNDRNPNSFRVNFSQFQSISLDLVQIFIEN